MLVMGYVMLLLRSLSLQYNYFELLYSNVMCQPPAFCLNQFDGLVRLFLGSEYYYSIQTQVPNVYLT